MIDLRSEDWHRHFLQLCTDHARRSKDPSTKVGALIVGPDWEIRSSGFNRFPRGIRDLPARLEDRETKLKLIICAERTAVLAAARVGTPVKGCTLYIAATDASGIIWGGPPCVRCTVEVIEAGIDVIVSYPMKSSPSRWADDLRSARSLLAEAGIIYREIALVGEIKPMTTKEWNEYPPGVA